MPIYEYHCQSCDTIFDQFQKMNDPPPAHCPDCNGDKIKKLISMSTFHLKGTGWYATDYKSGSKNGSKTKTKPQNSSSEASDEGTSKKESAKIEAKPAKESSAGASA